jgi:hypothetical protein
MCLVAQSEVMGELLLRIGVYEHEDARFVAVCMYAAHQTCRSMRTLDVQQYV